MQSLAGLGLQIDFWRNPRRVSGFKSVFGVKPGGYREMSGARPFRDVWGANAIISVSFVGYAFGSTRIGRTPCATLSRMA